MSPDPVQDDVRLYAALLAADHALRHPTPPQPDTHDRTRLDALGAGLARLLAPALRPAAARDRTGPPGRPPFAGDGRTHAPVP